MIQSPTNGRLQLTVFLFAHLSLAHALGQSDQTTTRIEEAQLKETSGEVYFYEGKSYTGLVVKTHPNKKKAESYSLKNGKLNGVWKGWDEEGNLVGQAEYQNGKIHGKFLQLRKTGGREFEVNYVNGVENGAFRRWFDDGKLWVIENYLAGKLDGVSTTYFPDGKIQVSAVYRAGKKHGLEIHRYENGQPRWEAVYEEGKLKTKLRWKRDGTPSGQNPPKIL